MSDPGETLILDSSFGLGSGVVKFPEPRPTHECVSPGQHDLVTDACLGSLQLTIYPRFISIRFTSFSWSLHQPLQKQIVIDGNQRVAIHPYGFTCSLRVLLCFPREIDPPSAEAAARGSAPGAPKRNEPGAHALRHGGSGGCAKRYHRTTTLNQHKQKCITVRFQTSLYRKFHIPTDLHRIAPTFPFIYNADFLMFR